MIDYNNVVTKIQEKIADFSKKLSGKDAAFYSKLIARLQTQLDNLQSKGEANATLQDKITAWQTYREVCQEKKIKFYADNKFPIIGLAVLVGAIGVNVVYSLSKKKG